MSPTFDNGLLSQSPMSTLFRLAVIAALFGQQPFQLLDAPTARRGSWGVEAIKCFECRAFRFLERFAEGAQPKMTDYDAKHSELCFDPFDLCLNENQTCENALSCFKLSGTMPLKKSASRTLGASVADKENMKMFYVLRSCSEGQLPFNECKVISGVLVCGCSYDFCNSAPKSLRLLSWLIFNGSLQLVLFSIVWLMNFIELTG